MVVKTKNLPTETEIIATADVVAARFARDLPDGLTICQTAKNGAVTLSIVKEGVKRPLRVISIDADGVHTVGPNEKTLRRSIRDVLAIVAAVREHFEGAVQAILTPPRELEPGTYVLTEDVPNPHHRKGRKYDWRMAESVFKAGTRFTAARTRWYKPEEDERMADLVDEDGWIYEIVLTRHDRRSMYSVSSRDTTARSLWKQLVPHLEPAKESIHDIMLRSDEEHGIRSIDVLEALMRAGRLTLDEMPTLIAEIKAWGRAQRALEKDE